jgi:hypothetical protein
MAVPGIKVDIGADTSGLDRGLTSAQKSIVRFAGAASAAIAAVPAVMLALGRASMNVVDAQAKLAKQLGGTTTSIQSMQRAADLSGVSMGALQSASERINRTLGAVARTGAGEAYEALKRVGLSAEQLAALDVDERLAVIADAIKNAGMSASETADFLAQLGIRQGEVSRMMMDGGDAIRSAREQVDLYGVSVSELDNQKIQEANDKWSEFALAMRGIGNQIATQMAPLMIELADKFRDVIEKSGGIKNITAPAFEAFFRAVKLVSDNMDTLIKITVVLIGLKLAPIIIGLGVAFVTMAAAIRTATIATIALGVAKAGLSRNIAGVALVLGSVAVATGTTEKLFEALGFDISAVTKQLDSFSSSAGGAEGALARLAAAQQGSPFGNLDAAFRDPKLNPKQKPPGGGGGGGFDPLQQQRDEIAQRLAMIKDGFMSEHELLIQKYEDDRNIIDMNFQMQMEKFQGNKEMERQIAEEHNSLMQQLEAKHQGALAEIRDAGMNDALTGTARIFNSLGRLVQSGGQKNVRLAKTFGIAEALISTFVAANKAMAYANTAGPAAGFAAYAAVAAQGLSAVARIRSISDSGGGGGGSASVGGGGSFSVDPQNPGATGASGSSVYINLQGQSFGRDQVRDLLEQISSYQKDGGQVVFA